MCIYVYMYVCICIYIYICDWNFKWGILFSERPAYASAEIAVPPKQSTVAGKKDS